MVRKDNYDELLEYVCRLGFTVRPGFPGWIPAAQKRMCDVADKIWEMADKTFPIKVHYFRKSREFYVHTERRGHWYLNGVVDARKL